MELDSFVLVEREDGSRYDASELSAVAAFFPSITTPTSFNLSSESLTAVREARQQRPDQRLFVDELLGVLGLDGALFPPASASALDSLLFQLLTGPERLTANCIIFYLLLADASSPTDPRPTAFVRAVHLPVGHTRTIEGFYALDSGSWRSAVAALTDPHLTNLDANLVDKTFKVLSTLAPEDARAKLVLSYWRLSGLPLASEEQAGIVVDALCDRQKKLGVVEAWAIQRAWGDVEVQARLVRRVLLRCFGDNPTKTPAPHHLHLLLAHPFTALEDDLVSSFCLVPSNPIAQTPALAALAADWRISKLIAEGRPVDALRFGRQVSTGGLRGADERARLLRAVRETLTEVQRNAVDLEAESASSAAAHRPATASSSLAAANGHAQLTQPAWQPAPLASGPSQPASRSLLMLSKTPAPPPTPVQPSELPLSASPFLRHEKPLVSTADGTSLGGVQKNLLRALREGTSATATPDKGKGRADAFVASGASPRFPGFMAGSPARSDAGGSSLFNPHGQSPRPLSIVFGQDGREVHKERKPTLSGFGSRRMPSSMRDLAAFADDSLAHEDVDDTFDLSMRASPPPPVLAPAPRSTRAADNAAAATSKRRILSAQQQSVSGDKRRAVSTEAEDRPSSSVKVAAKKVPGGFPGHHSDLESEPDVPAPTKGRKRAPVRRSARASSVQPLPATPTRARRATSAQVETPKEDKAVRRSSRRIAATQVEEERPKRRVTTGGAKKPATASRRKVLEEDDEE